MSTRWADWLRQANADLAHARHALAGAHHEWACFAAQQAAEKALKSVHGARGLEAWGHSVTELLDSLRREGLAVDDAMLDLGRALDKLYVATRYPNGLPAGAPADYYTRAEAERAIADAEVLLAWCQRELPR
ncbi:MAG TPA: HEPN domain-containing protein [Vicinamibacterales bacterium]|nr:HEPN domain-containing protein [Vicinamibacterales bacterium]